jgi:hypothetical protein
MEFGEYITSRNDFAISRSSIQKARGTPHGTICGGSQDEYLEEITERTDGLSRDGFTKKLIR